jgi:hypothetical protein
MPSWHGNRRLATSAHGTVPRSGAKRYLCVHMFLPACLSSFPCTLLPTRPPARPPARPPDRPPARPPSSGCFFRIFLPGLSSGSFRRPVLPCDMYAQAELGGMNRKLAAQRSVQQGQLREAQARADEAAVAQVPDTRLYQTRFIRAVGAGTSRPHAQPPEPGYSNYVFHSNCFVVVVVIVVVRCWFQKNG